MPIGKAMFLDITSVAPGDWPALTRLCESQFVALPPYSGELVTSRHVFDSRHNPFRNASGEPIDAAAFVA